MPYTNPVLHVDDEYESTIYSMTFEFKTPVTIDEAAQRINKWLEKQGGEITSKQLRMGESRRMRHVLPQNRQEKE